MTATCRAALLVFLLFSGAAYADRCQVVSRSQAEAALAALDGNRLLARYCAACGDSEPVPLRIRSYSIEPWGGGGVVLEGRRFSADQLRQARESRSGPLEKFIALLVAGDEEGREFLLDALADNLADSLVRLRLNDSPADLAYLYRPDGDGRWSNVGREIGCAGASTTLAWRLPPRDPALERPPPVELLAPIIDRAYDGSRFSYEWSVSREQLLLAAPDEAADPVGRLRAGERVSALEVVTRIEPARVRVVHDNEAFLEGDVLYVLDGLGEGRHRVWHYGRIIVADVGDLALEPGGGARYCTMPSPNCWGEAEQPPRETWWGWVRGPDGTEGWVRQPTEGFAEVMRGN